MKLFDRIIDGYMKRKGLDPTIPGQNLMPVNSFNIFNMPQQDFVAAYEGNGDLYAVVNFLLRKAASIPWYVYTQKTGPQAKASLERYKRLTHGLGNPGAMEQALISRKGSYDENAIVDNSSLAKRLNRPNEHQGQDQFFESVFGFRLLSGEGNIWGNSGVDGSNKPDTTGEFLELQVLPTQFIGMATDPHDLFGIKGYRLNVGGGINIPRENMLMWKNWRPGFDNTDRRHMRGISPVQVAWKNYQMSDQAAQRAANMLANGGSKGALAPKSSSNTMVPTMTKDQADMAKKMVNENINGNERAGTIGVLAREYDYLNFGLSAVEMELVNVMHLTLHQWCRVFGLPTVMFDSAHTSDNNYQNAMRDVVTNTVMPMMASLRDELNRWLVPRFGEKNVFIDFDIMALPELQRDMEKLTNSLSKAYWLTEDEKRIAMNYETKGGAYDTSLVPTGLTPIENVGMDVSVPPPADPNVGY